MKWQHDRNCKALRAGLAGQARNKCFSGQLGILWMLEPFLGATAFMCDTIKQFRHPVRPCDVFPSDVGGLDPWSRPHERDVHSSRGGLFWTDWDVRIFLFRERTCYIKGLLMCSSWLTLFQETYIQNILSRVRQLWPRGFHQREIVLRH